MYFRNLFSFFTFFICLTISSLGSTASAHPTRVMLWAHGSARPNENGLTTVRSDLALCGIETGRPFAYVYLGPGFDLSKQVRMDLFGGYDTGNEAIASPRLVLNFDKFSTWTLAEYYSKNKGGYLFQMADYAPATWLKAGVEYEWFGSYKSLGNSSHGFGPHLLFNLGQYGLDVVLQARQYTPGDWDLVPVLRAHFFLGK